MNNKPPYKELENKIKDLEKTTAAGKKIEEELRRSELRLRNIIEAAGKYVYEADIEGIISFISSRVRDILGYDPEELLGKSAFSVLVSREEIERVQKIYRELIKEKLPVRNMDHKCRTKDGRERILSVTAWPIFNEAGEITGFQGMAGDITEHRQAEDELRQREMKYRLLAENMNDMVWMIDARSFRFLYISPSLEKMLGYNREEALQMHPRQMMPPESAEISGMHFRKSIQTADTGSAVECPSFEIQLFKKDLTLIWTEVSYSLVYDAAGHVFAVQGVNRDITKRKMTEEALLESEKKYRLITEKMTDIVWIMNTDMHVIYITPSVKTILGFTQEEILQQRAIEKLTPDSLALGLETMTRELTLTDIGEAEPGRNVTLLLEFNHKDGSTRWMETIISGIRNDQGILTGLHGVSRDITKRKKAEEELNDVRQKLDQIIEFLPDATAVIGKDGKVIAWNKAMEKLSGIPKSNMIGKGNYEYALPFYGERRMFMSDLLLLPDVELNMERYDNVQNFGDVYCVETFAPKMHGSKGAHLWAAACLLRDAEGNVIGNIESIRDITERKQAQMERDKLITELQKVISEVKTLSGLLPICAACKKIRNDKGYWEQLECYIAEHTEAEFSHGICPECAKILYPGFCKKNN